MGLTSRAGVFPLSLLADIAGPIARTVEDATKVFQVIVGADPADPVTAAAPAHLPQDYLSALDRNGLRGVTIGVLRPAYERGGGPCMGFKYDLNRYLAGLGDQVAVKSLADVIKSRGFHPSVQNRLEQADKGPENGPESAACKAETEYREKVRVAVNQTMDKLKLDAFVYPTWSNVPRLIGDLNTPAGDNSQFYSPTTGFPAINVPMGFTRGGTLPAGMTIYGRAWSEPKLIKYAYAFEQATMRRHAPPSTPPLK
jgi:Asp-tRNA(Asn)/Glu-tRNA(Gln) amidotransferase A subunit family amidase